ncbi:MAG: restriction endonuclease subunit S [Brevundimonas sp.]|nr:restriction endonuclease subunit S [Brevundimonas sp.]
MSGKMYRMRPSHHVEPRYVEAALRTAAAQEAIDQLKTGMSESGMNLTHERFATLRVPVAPAAEQRRIVAKLDALTARMARARADLDRIPSLAARYKLSLLRKAVRGELTEAWRQQAKPEPTADLLNRIPPPQQGRGGRDATTEVVPGQAALSVNHPGTPAPHGWAWTSLLRIARQETGHTPSRSVAAYWGGEVPWIGIRDAGAHHGRTITDTLQTITEEGLANSSARLLPARTVCLSRTASVGYVTIMARPMATSQDFATWTCSEALVPEFLMYALMAEGDDIRAFGEGSTHTTIYFPAIRALHICLPSPEEQHEIVQRVRAGLAEIDRLAAEAAAARRLLDRLDQAILAKAFRGELVAQDPADEPADVLLERIRAERAAAPKAKRRGRAAAA